MPSAMLLYPDLTYIQAIAFHHSFSMFISIPQFLLLFDAMWRSSLASALPCDDV